MAEESSAFTSSTNWDHEEQRGSSQFSLCKDLQGVCTQTNIKFNRSFEDVSQRTLLTSPRGEGFPKASGNALKTKVFSGSDAAQRPTSLLLIRVDRTIISAPRWRSRPRWAGPIRQIVAMTYFASLLAAMLLFANSLAYMELPDC
jgi:hypothetical protein